jgi:hypothetical protein
VKHKRKGEVVWGVGGFGNKKRKKEKKTSLLPLDLLLMRKKWQCPPWHERANAACGEHSLLACFGVVPFEMNWIRAKISFGQNKGFCPSSSFFPFSSFFFPFSFPPLF